ncbi:hypothetical protein vseg_009510 [Gypsophila vaccaria]
MEVKAKLSRNQSSLLRSSPTVRSSIHSLSSIVDLKHISDEDDDDDHRRRVNHRGNCSSVGAYKVVSLLCLGTVTLIVTFMCINLRQLNLLIGLILISIAVFYLGKNRGATVQKERSDPVKWFIGEETALMNEGKWKGVGDTKVKEGVECYSNGDYYEGEFYRGKSSGSGVYNYSVKGRYEGEWVDGRYDGYGIESWAKGSRYRGMYRGGLRHGYGVYRFYTGDTYAGQWCNGQYHGLGVQSCCDASCYVGQFKCGVKHALGCYHFRNGDRYAGEYFGDKIHGFGVYHFANGHCYEGSWHEGRKQGYGMYTFRNGEPKCGEWDSGSLKTSLPPLTDSVLRAVQAARKAAENAINLKRVDEQVNKAVVGANRAATAARVAAVKAVQNRLDGKFYNTDD